MEATRQFFRHELKGPLEQGRATWQHDANVQNHADVNDFQFHSDLSHHNVLEDECHRLR